MLNDLDAIREMIVRGLDADLDRAEVRRLFLRVARDDVARKEMGELAAMEEALSGLAQRSLPQGSLPDLSGRVVAALRVAPARPFRRFSMQEVFLRIAAIKMGLRMRPFRLSFGAGLVVAAVALLVLVPYWGRVAPGEGTRLVVHDLQFIDAKPRVAWTNQFIVPPGGETRFALRLGAEKPLRIQFQTVEPAPVRVVHDAPGSFRGSVNVFTIDGIGYATLRRPRTGDGVIIQNQGPVPLVVYLQGVGSDGTIFSHPTTDRRQAL